MHSVLYVVLAGESARWRPALDELHREFFGPGRSDPLAPVKLEVVNRATAACRLRMARVLGEAAMDDEARAPVLDAALALARALAIENRLTGPDKLEDALAPLFAPAWGHAFGMVHRFVREPASPWKQVVDALQGLAARSAR